MQEMQVQSLGQDDPLEKEMATHSSILACKVPWTEEPGGLQSMGSQRAGHDWAHTPPHNEHSDLCICDFPLSMMLFEHFRLHHSSRYPRSD